MKTQRNKKQNPGDQDMIDGVVDDGVATSRAVRDYRKGVESMDLTRRIKSLDKKVHATLTEAEEPKESINAALTHREVKRAIRERPPYKIPLRTTFESNSSALNAWTAIVLGAVPLVTLAVSLGTGLNETTMGKMFLALVMVLSLFSILVPVLGNALPTRNLRNYVFNRSGFNKEVERIVAENRVSHAQREVAKKKLEKLEGKVADLSTQCSYLVPGKKLIVNREEKKIDLVNDVKYSNAAQITLSLLNEEDLPLGISR